MPAAAREHEVVRALRRIHAAFPTALPRATLVRIRRSLARLERITALGGPPFLLGSEAELLLGTVESASQAVAPKQLAFDPEDGFQTTFVRGLEACVIREPGAAGAADLGLGASAAVPVLLGISGENLRQLYERWVESAPPSHPLKRYPHVPRGRFCEVTAARHVRGDLDSTGPIGWAAGEDVATLARDLVAVGRERSVAASELQAAADRVELAAGHGHAVIGLIEYLPPEAEGQRKWLIDPEARN